MTAAKKRQGTTRELDKGDEDARWRIGFIAGCLVAAKDELEEQGFDRAAGFVEMALFLVGEEVASRH